MAVTVTQLIQDTLRELNEATSSSLGSVGDGAGADTVTTTTTLYNFITQAAVDWCETAWALPGTASLSSWTSGTKTQQLHALTVPSGQGRLHAVTGLALGATPAALELISLASLRQNFPGMDFAANGSSLYYYVEPSFVGVYPAPSANIAAALVGYCVPVKAGASANSTTATEYSFAPDDILLRVIPTKAAILLAEKTFDDPSVFGRLDHLKAKYFEWQMKQRSRMSEETLQHFKMPVKGR